MTLRPGFCWGLHPQIKKGRRGRALWHLFRRYQEPAERWQRHPTRTVGEFYSVCQAQYEQRHVEAWQADTPVRTETCQRCWHYAKEKGLR